MSMGHGKRLHWSWRKGRGGDVAGRAKSRLERRPVWWEWDEYPFRTICEGGRERSYSMARLDTCEWNARSGSTVTLGGGAWEYARRRGCDVDDARVVVERMGDEGYARELLLK
jgi:hypothetical protein